MIAVARFDDNRYAQILRGLPSLCGRVNSLTNGHGYAAGLQQRFCEVFIARDGFGDGSGAIGFSCPDAPLIDAIAKLQKVARVESDGGDVAVVGGVDNAGCTGAKAMRVAQFLQVCDRGLEVNLSIVKRGFKKIASSLQCVGGYAWVPRAHDDLVQS